MAIAPGTFTYNPNVETAAQYFARTQSAINANNPTQAPINTDLSKVVQSSPTSTPTTPGSMNVGGNTNAGQAGVDGPNTAAAYAKYQQTQSTADYNAWMASKGLNPSGQPLNAPPPMTQIGTQVNPPSQTGTPQLPHAQAPSIADQFNTSLSATLQAQQNQLKQALQTQTQNYQTKIDALNQQVKDAQDAENMGMLSEQSTVQAETQAKQAALDQEQQQFQQNYQARQQLVGQLNTLLTTGQQVIEQMKNTTGLASIMNPRITQTMTDVQGQAGVITAALSAYDTQIGLAQNQLKSATEAITSIYSDQLNYWQNVVSFYDSREKNIDGQIANLTKDQKTYIDAQMQMLQDNVTNTQKTADLVSKAMLDPTTALAYAKAGVSLTDSPAQINQKLATYAQAQQNVWGPPHFLGGDYIQTNKLTGETRTVVSNVPTGGGASSGLTKAGIQNGAANAGVSIDDFKNLPIDVQNYYNQLSSTNANAINTLIQQANSGDADPQTVKDQIDQSNAAPAVKMYLKSLIKPKAASSGGGFSKIVDFFKGAWSALTGQ